MNLLIDIGNTRLKWGIADDSHIRNSQALLNEQLTQQNLIKIWQNLPMPEKLAMACVSANWLQDLVQIVAEQLWPHLQITIAKAQAHAFGVVNAYEQPEALGVDRWLALIAARHHYATPACIVDCGTAITLDVIDALGYHRGGLISPGLTLMKQALARGTEQLSLSDTQFTFGLAKKTDAAIYNGTLASAVGLIEHLWTQHQGSQLILTGGDANLIAKHLLTQPVIDTDLVLRGLAIILQG